MRSFVLLLCLAAVTGAAPVSQYVVRRCNAAITIDGILDEPTWRQSDSIPFSRCADWGKPNSASSVRFAWDTACLYIAITAQDRDLWGTFTRHDDPVYQEEALEFFFDPDGDGRNYAEIDFNCRGAMIDIWMINPATWQSSLAWSASNTRYAVKKRGTIGDSSDIDTGYTLEAAFAWKDFRDSCTVALPPRAGDTLRANAYRIEGRTDPKEWSCWSAIESTAPGCFHTPSRFGKLNFSDQPVVAVHRTPTSRRTMAGAIAGYFDLRGASLQPGRPARRDASVLRLLPDRTAIRLIESR